jgi:hypothetical protein
MIDLIVYKRRTSTVLLLCLCTGLVLALMGCTQAEPEVPADLYRPPTLDASIGPLTVTQPANPEAALLPTPDCIPGLVYLEDLTIPDGMIVLPGQSLDKRWKVENTGECNWDERFSLRLVAGPGLSAHETQALYPARSGTTAEIRIIFTAPDKPGSYRSAWQAHDPQGHPFGDPIFIDIFVTQ